MSDRKLSSWFYPKPTGDPGRDRNAQTVQFTCLLFALAIGLVAVLDTIAREPILLPILELAVLALVVAAIVNRAGKSAWASRTAILAILLTATMLVFEARDGLRSLAMLIFPGLLLISVMLLDRASYLTTAGIVLVAVAALGIAERRGFTRAIPGVRSPTSYESIFYVDLTLMVFGAIGGRIVRDTQRNAFDLRASLNRLAAANLELVQVKEHLQDSEQRLKSAQRLTHVGSWHWNLVVNQVECSEECKHIFGQPEDYAPSLDGLLQIISQSDRARVADEIQRSIGEKNGGSMEFQIVRPDGDLRTVTFNSQVLLDENGSPKHIFGACQDVTGERRAQAEAFARQKLETVGTLAGGIAHDFNNLLGGVLAQAELGLSELAAKNNPEEELKAIRDVAIRGSEIVRELMIYGGAESGVVELVDVSRIVSEMLELLKISLSKHAVLETDLSQDLPTVRASAAQLRQIVMNVVTNASDAMGDRDGVIRVTTRHGVPTGKWSDSESLSESEYVVFEVSDTGCGMSRATQARVFDPFFTTKSPGRGLGLAVVSGIVRSLGGAIRITSELDKGTTFRILLPGAASTSGLTGSATELIEAGAGAAVLVVEDEAVLRQAVAKMLRKTGFEVFEAADGSSAIDLLRANRDKIDVILLDMTLPGATSQDVVTQAAQARPDLKVVLTSAYGQEMITNAVSGPQIRGFIRKPFRIGELVNTLRRAASA
jgi:PAS domain S-box-containing protein